MATAAAAKKTSRNSSSSGKARTRTARSCAARCAPAARPMVSASLRRQGILVTKVKKRRMSGGRSIKQKDIAIFTRQLATMMKAGVPLLQAFDIVARGSTNPQHDQAAHRHPHRRRDRHQPVGGVPQAPAVLRRAVLQPGRGRRGRRHPGSAARPPGASTRKRRWRIKNKIKSALIYPIAVMVVAFVVLTVIMIFVIPAFKDVFTSFGADLPAPTLFVIAMSEFFVSYWWADLRRPRSAARYFFFAVVEALREDADGDGPPAAEGAGLRRPDQQVGHRALDAHAVDDVRRRRAAGRGARLGRRRLGQRGLRARPPSRSRRTSRPARR